MNYEELKDVKDNILRKQTGIQKKLETHHELMLQDLNSYLVDQMDEIVANVIKEQAHHTNELGRASLTKMKNELVDMQNDILPFLTSHFDDLTCSKFIQVMNSKQHVSLVKDAKKLYDYSLNNISEETLGFCGNLLEKYGYEVRIYERTLSDWLPIRKKSTTTFLNFSSKFLYTKHNNILNLNKLLNIKKHKDLYIAFYSKEDHLLRVDYQMQQITAEQLWDSV